MTEVLDSGHVVTDEDVDTARLILELDRALGRPSDSRTQRVAATPLHQISTVQYGGSAAAGAQAAKPAGTNGHHAPAADDLVKTLTSEENAAELAREVADELPADPDPAEQARVVSRVQDVIRRRMMKLVAETDTGH